MNKKDLKLVVSRVDQAVSIWLAVSFKSILVPYWPSAFLTLWSADHIMVVPGVPKKFLRIMLDRLGTKLEDVPSMYCPCFVLPPYIWSVSSIEQSLASPLNSSSMIVVRSRVGVAALLSSGNCGGVFFVFLGRQMCWLLPCFESESTTSLYLTLAVCSSMKFR